VAKASPEEQVMVGSLLAPTEAPLPALRVTTATPPCIVIAIRNRTISHPQLALFRRGAITVAVLGAGIPAGGRAGLR